MMFFPIILFLIITAAVVDIKRRLPIPDPEEIKTLNRHYTYLLHSMERIDTRNMQYSPNICSSIVSLHMRQVISREQKHQLLAHLYANKPNFFSWFYWDKAFDKGDTGYWWTRDQKGYAQRIKFLQHLIKKTK